MDHETIHIIDAAALIPAKLCATPLGFLFVALRDSRNEDETPFVAGKVNETEVLIGLRGEQRMLVRERTRSLDRSGYKVADVRFEVDRSAARRCSDESDCRPGDLVRFPNGLGIIGRDNHQQYLVELNGVFLEQRQPVLIAFDRWELVVGSGIERRVLYHYTSDELLFGPFHPAIDDVR